MYFGKNIKYLRLKKGLKQSEMIDFVGFKQTTWNGYETQKSFPKFEDLVKISKYFDISETDLIHKDLENEGFTKTKKTEEINQSHVETQNKLIQMQEKEILRLEKELAEMKYTQREPIVYPRVAESAPELMKKESK